MYGGSREIGQPGSYLAQASFRKFVCVRGSVSSVLRCVRGRNEYRNNVSMGMTRRSFYLLNLRRISRDGAREERQERRKKRGSGKKGGKVRENEERRRRRWRYDSSFSVYRQYSHRAVLKASRISIYLFGARKKEGQPPSSSPWMMHRMFTIKRENSFSAASRATTHLRNVAVGTLADVILSQYHDFVSMTTRMRMGKKHRRPSEFEIPTFPGRENVGISKRTRLVASIESCISRHRLFCWCTESECMFFTAFDKRWGLSDR